MSLFNISSGALGISAKLRALILLALSVLVLGWAANVLIHLPRMPYNVVEMFGGNPSWSTLARFALSLLSIGMGAHFAAYLASLARGRALTLPLWCILAVLVTLGIAQRAITDETFDDFTGSPDLYREIVEENSWGNRAAHVVAQANGGLMSHVERMVRFVSLVTPLVLWLAIFDMTFSRPLFMDRLRTFFAHVILAVPWLMLFKYIAFDVPSTDNLVELISPGGGIFLYGLLLVIALAGASVGSLRRFGPAGKAVTIIFFISSVPLGWYLLNHGIASGLNKQGTVYSGLDFLLGPNRESKLATAVLAARWAGLQIIAMSGLAWSMMIATQFFPNFHRRVTKKVRRPPHRPVRR